MNVQTVIHSIASAQSRVATLHLIVQELLVLLVVPAAIEAPTSVRGRSAKPRTQASDLGWRSCQDRLPHMVQLELGLPGTASIVGSAYAEGQRLVRCKRASHITVGRTVGEGRIERSDESEL
jgi:hypothetical protein